MVTMPQGSARTQINSFRRQSVHFGADPFPDPVTRAARLVGREETCSTHEVSSLIPSETDFLGATMSTEVDQVKAAFAAYIAALSSLDMRIIDPLWAHDDTVTQVEPNSEAITVGWTAVRKNLESFFGGFAELKIHVADGPYVQIVGDVAWTTSQHHSGGRQDQGGRRCRAARLHDAGV
jgi:ketosteroid isomerase-like protein